MFSVSPCPGAGGISLPLLRRLLADPGFGVIELWA
jgi:hypothetical protein